MAFEANHCILPNSKHQEMKAFKKILKIFVISIVAIIVILIASAYLFRGKIVSLVKSEINKNLVAKVDFKTVDISFFRHFPRVSIGLDNLQVTGTGIFSADTLLSAQRLDAAVDIMSFIRGKDMNIYSIFLNSPRIHALVNKDGLANWNIVKVDTTATSVEKQKPFHLQLKKYEISNGYIFYDDRQTDMSAEIENLNHKGSGDFTSDVFTLDTQTSADAVTYYYGSVPFLYKTKTNIDADLKIDNLADKYSFENLSVLLNALKITGSGFVKMLDKGYDIDFNFKSPGTDFKEILSLIPAVYKKDFNKVQASGTASFQGNVKGIYNDLSMPAYHVSMVIKDGSFKYSDLPKSIQQINLNAVVENPDGITDHTVIDISKGHFQVDNDPFDFRLLVKNPLSTRFIDAAAKGKLDLSKVSEFVKLDKGTSIAGLLNADVSVKGNVSDVEKRQYQDFNASGIVNANGFNYVSSDYPEGIKINTVNTSFSPSRVEVSNLSGSYLKSNFDGSGYVNNLLNYLISDKPLSASFAVHADKVDLNKWMGVSDDTTQHTGAAPFIVPKNLDVSLSAKVDQLNYDKLDMKNLAGELNIANEMVKLNNIHADALDGTISINGSYSTKKNPKNPAINLSYNIDKVDIQKAFYAFNTAQKMMPIGKFLAGKLSSSLTATGLLGNDMNVEMNSLSGQGNLLLIEGFLSKFAPLEKIASTLHVSQLQNISLKDVKAFFEFSNGKMLVKPFNVTVNNIEMEIGGLQGFDQSLNYTIDMKLPRSLIGSQGNQLINNLASKVSSAGIPVNVGDVVNLRLDLGGTIKSPTVKVDLKQTGESLATQMKDQVKEFAQAKIDSAKSAASDTLQSLKKQVTDAAKEELRKQLLGIKDSGSSAENKTPEKKVVEKATESARGLLKGILKKEKDTTKK